MTFVSKLLLEQYTALTNWFLSRKGIRVSGQIAFEGVGPFEYFDEYIYDLSNGEFVIQAHLDVSMYISFDSIRDHLYPEDEYTWQMNFKLIEIIVPITATMKENKIVELSATGEATFEYGQQPDFGGTLEHD